jgi:tRNA-2-methylthio-N6-dimethylallyladenosine synthase
VDGIRRIRFTSPHPKDIKEDVLVAMAETPAVCEMLHLPLQSGSATILRAMQRGYTPERFMAKLRAAEAIIPGLATSTDLIVGFPGETEEDFQATLDLVEEARFDGAFMFIYSPRPGTPAAEMDGHVDPEVASERFSRLADLQRRISVEKNRHLIGRTLEILVEGPSRKDHKLVTARTRTNKVVHAPGAYPAGTFLDAVVEHAAPSHLIGRVST